MPIKLSGELSFDLDIVDEFGGVVPHSLTEYYGADSASSTPQVPTSGEIAFSDFYGADSSIQGAKLLVVGGGSSGGDAGGGGAGGAAYYSNFTFTKGVTYTVTIGAGGGRPTWTYVSLSSYGNGYRRGDTPQTTMIYHMDGANNWTPARGNSGTNSSVSGSGISTVVGGGAPRQSSVYTGVNYIADAGCATGSASAPGGGTTYTNPRVDNAGAGLLNSTRSNATVQGQPNHGGHMKYQGGNGRTFTFATGHSYTVGGGGTGCNYRNVSGDTPGGNVAGGSGGGGKSAYVNGSAGGGVSPAAGLGNPPADNAGYIKGGNAPANSGSGGGCGSRIQVLPTNGEYGAYMGTGGSGVVIIGYPGTTPKFSPQGTVTNVNGYITHKYTSTTTISF